MSNNCWRRARKQTYEKLHKTREEIQMKKRLKKKRKTYMINDVIDGIVDTMTVADHSTIIFTVDHTLVRTGSFHNKTLRYIMQKLKQDHDIDSVVVIDNAVKATLAEGNETHNKRVYGDVDA